MRFPGTDASRPTAIDDAIESLSTARNGGAARMQVNQFTLPPEAILIRRMHGVVAIVLRQLRAGADWGGIAAEYLHGASPATPLGQAEADFFPRSGRAARAAP